MSDHWGDSAESALDCVFATLEEWYGGGPKELAADNREHAVRAVLFAQQRLVELRGERDELEQAGAAILLSKVSAMPEDLAAVTRERDELREQNSKLHRDLAGARRLARWLWRLDGVRQQWTPPAKYELDWLTRDEPS